MDITKGRRRPKLLCAVPLRCPVISSFITSLVPHFLQPQSALPHTAVVIVLECTRPWTDGLHTWLTWVKCWVQGDGARELEVIREEHRERCMSHLIFILVASVLTIPS